VTFTIKKDDLSRLVAACASVAKKESPVDIAQLITLSVDNGTMKGRATDLENWITVHTQGDGNMEDISIDAGKLREVVAGIRGDVLTLAVTDGYLHLAAKGGGKRKVMGRISTYPSVDAPKGDTVAFNVDRLRECLAFCAPTVCDDESKLGGAISGIHIHTIGGQYRAVSTTGQSFAAVDICPSGDVEVASTITKRTIGMLDHVPEAVMVDVTFAENKVAIAWPGGEIVAKKIAMDFVNYMAAVAEHSLCLAVRPSEVLAAIKAVQSTATEEIQAKSKRVKIVLADDVEMVSGNQQGDEGREPMDASWSGPPGDVAFVTKRMADLLAGFGDDEISIGITPLSGSLDEKPKPMLIKSLARPDRFAVLMPLRFL